MSVEMREPKGEQLATHLQRPSDLASNVPVGSFKNKNMKETNWSVNNFQICKTQFIEWS